MGDVVNAHMLTITVNCFPASSYVKFKKKIDLSFHLLRAFCRLIYKEDLFSVSLYIEPDFLRFDVCDVNA